MLLFMTRFEGIIISVSKGAGKYLGPIQYKQNKYKIQNKKNRAGIRKKKYSNFKYQATSLLQPYIQPE